MMISFVKIKVKQRINIKIVMRKREKRKSEVTLLLEIVSKMIRNLHYFKLKVMILVNEPKPQTPTIYYE